jgi:hypothetical protein
MYVIPLVHCLTVKTFSAITLHGTANSHFTTVSFFSFEDPAVFCIALELVSQLSFCVKLSSCEKRTVREALL